MGLMLGPTGKLMTKNGKLFVDTNGSDCCCLVDTGCVGCGKWVSDEAGNLVVTLSISGCGMSHTEAGLILGGNTNCNDVSVNVSSAAFSIFSADFDIVFVWNSLTLEWEATIPASLNEANCTAAGSHTVTAYSCVQCSSFHWEATVAVSGDGCSCDGEVITFTIDIDLTGGIDCP